ncbi:MAG: hypothetical protein NWE92_07660 [Candidatus Bathyarchaeota archaeon]|nr:hypothetical protein [Candidatus Bathyarchaeota archaeon]
MANVTFSDVRDTINLTSSDIPDDKLQKMVNRAATTLALELNKPVDPTGCTDAEKEFITLLSAVYAICYLTGGSAVGLNFSVGDQNISVAGNTPPLAVLQAEVERLLCSLKKPSLRSA